MKENPDRENRENLSELLRQYDDLKAGRSHQFLDEEAFERIIEFYDEKEDLQKALEASEFGSGTISFLFFTSY